MSYRAEDEPYFIYNLHDPATFSSDSLFVDYTDLEEKDVRQGPVLADKHSQTGWLWL